MTKKRFYLRPTGATGSIWIKISLGRFVQLDNGKKTYQPLRLPLGITGITDSQWDKEKERLYTRSDKNQNITKHPLAVHYNGMLENAEARIWEIVGNAITYNKTNEEIKELYLNDDILSDILCRKAKKIKEASIYDDKSVFLFIQKEVIDKATVEKATIQTYVTTLAHMKAFETHRGRLTTWKTIDEDYHKDLKTYLYNKGLGDNTIRKYTKVLKKFLKEADYRNIDVSKDYKFDRFVAKPKDSQAVYITLDELDRIEALDYSNNPRLDRVRDWLLIGSNTGLRVSDLMRLEAHHIQGNKIKILTKKTNVEVVIPIIPQLEKVISKYNGGFPTPISAQRYNDYLKEVTEDAQLNDMIVIAERKGSLSAPTQTPKYKLITSHTARRTFATNMYTRTDVNLTDAQIMLVTGHTTEKSFKTYLRVTKDENADTISEQFEKAKLKKAE